MFRHVVMLRWKPGTTDVTKAQVAERLAGLPAILPRLRSYCFGPDAGVNVDNYDFVIVADFDSVEDYLVYQDHPTHQAIIRELITPNAERAAVQYDAVQYVKGC